MAENMYHSIVFGDGTLVNGKFSGVDTYEDFHIIPTARPSISSPGVETKFVTIPGRDGAVDLSEFLRNGRPALGNRSGTIEFYVENGYDFPQIDEEFWMTIYPKLFNKLHGRRFKMVLREDDPDYYWDGRFTVDKYDAGDGHHSTVAISYALNPYKMRIRKNSQGMVWDNFNFEKDYDYSPWSLNSVNVSGSWSRTIWGEGYPFQLEVSCTSGSLSVTFGGETKALASGQSRKIGHAEYGNNTISITGTGTAVIDWRGGSL